MEYSFGLFGAAPDTGNLGVSALLRSTLKEFDNEFRSSRKLVFDNGLGARERTFSAGGQRIGVSLRGARGGKRFYRKENLWSMYYASKLGALGASMSSAVRELDSLHAILDISGGDSFSDIYGATRFWSIALPKLIALNRGIPLVLLPQTYGPFRDPKFKQLAESILRRSTVACARDPDSFEMMRTLLSDRFDPERHLNGVDMAFLLEVIDASEKLPSKLSSWLRSPRAFELVGLNVSGLIYNNPQQAKEQFGIAADYDELVLSVIAAVLRHSDTRIVLVPHVTTPQSHFESDIRACNDVLRRLTSQQRQRVYALDGSLDESETKWLISNMTWFCGSRMHACIAALSSGVPAVALAYSDKTRGVFETCGVADQVIDARMHDSPALLEQVLARFENRLDVADRISQKRTEVEARAQNQVSEIASLLRAKS